MNQISESDSSQQSTTTKKKTALLGYFDLSMIVVSLVIGMGIFKTPVSVAHDAISPTVFFLAWGIGGLMAICGGLTFAEIGSRLPVSGGYFRIFSHCYHPAFAFMINGCILISNAASVTGVALIGAEYISSVIFEGNPSMNTENMRVGIAAAEIILFLGLNLLGLKTSAKTLNVLTLFKLAVVLLVCSALFFPGHPLPPHHNSAGTVVKIMGHSTFIISLGLCLIPISFTYGGYQQTINFGGEVADAPRILPRAIISGMLLVIALYMAINYAYFNVIGFHNLKYSDSVAKIMATHVLGVNGGKIFTLLLFFSVLAYVNVGLMSNPRVICAMSEENTLPSIFSFHSKRFNVPVTSLVAFSLASLVILFFAKAFEQLVNYVIFLDALGFIAAATTIFVLRKRQGKEKTGIYKMRLYPWIPLLFIFAYGFVTFAVMMSRWKYALLGLCIFFAFLPLYFLFKRKKVDSVSKI